MAEGSNFNRENLPSEYDTIINLECKICAVELESLRQYREHIQGNSHKKIEEFAKQAIHSPTSKILLNESQSNSLVDNVDDDKQHCKLCNVSFTSPSHMTDHYKGKKHINAVNRANIKDIPLKCDDCSIPQFSSEISAKDHFDSERHKKKITEKSCDTNILSKLKVNNTKWIHCKICDVYLNSIEQYIIHCNSPRHKKRELNNPVRRDSSTPVLSEECLPSDENERRNEGLYNQTKDFPNGMSTPQRNEQEMDLTYKSLPKIVNEEKLGRNLKYNVSNLNHLEKKCNIKFTSDDSERSELKSGSLTEISSNLSDTVLLKETCHPANSDSTNERDFSRERSPSSLDETIPCKTYSETDSIRKAVPFEQFNNKPTDTTNNSTDLHNYNIDSIEKKANTNYNNCNNLSLPGEITQSVNDSENSELKENISSEQISNMISELNRLSIASNENKKITGLNNKIIQERSSSTGSSSQKSQTTNSISAPETEEYDIPYLQQKFIEKIERKGKIICYFCNLCDSQLNQGAVKRHIEGAPHRQKMMISPVIERNLPPVEQTCEDPTDEAFKQTVLIPRGYQVELFEKCHATDSIIFLPTGTGKTLCAAMLISYMLKKNPMRSVLFLVDKVLLVFQQKKYIETQLKGKFSRFDFEDHNKIVERELIIACICGGVVGTEVKPLWMHDIIISTAAFCLNMINQKVLQWSDLSFVVLDEAHHCAKNHPYNKIFSSQHTKLGKESRPKVLGLTASPAGQETLEGTIRMLLSLSINIGNAKITIVEDTVSELNKYKCNAKLEIEMLPPSNEELNFNCQLQSYLIQCLQYLKDKSNISDYIDFLDSKEKVVLNTEKLDELQNVYTVLQIDKDKAASMSLLWHIKKITFTLAVSLEMGIPLAMEELKSLLDPENNTDGFSKALEVGIPCHTIKELCEKYTNVIDIILEQDGIMSTVNFLIQKITNFINVQKKDNNTIVLVLVKQRSTAIRLSKILQESSTMKQYSLSTVSLVGHGAGTSTGMNISNQKKTLEEIKNNEHQVIIATSVAEEGIDLPQCSLVITMKPPTTVTTLVQMRGRVRKKNSLFLTICGSAKEKLKIENLLKQEETMEKASSNLINYYKKK